MGESKSQRRWLGRTVRAKAGRGQDGALGTVLNQKHKGWWVVEWQSGRKTLERDCNLELAVPEAAP